MADYMKVVVYIPAADVRMLRTKGEDDVAFWVRDLVKWALAEERKPEQVVPALPVSADDVETPAEKPLIPGSSKECPMSVPRGTRCKLCGQIH